MFTLNFWRQALERAAKTAAQALAIVWTGDGFNVMTADWKTVAIGVASGFAYSLISSIVTAGVGEQESPSAVAVASKPPEPEAGEANLGTVVNVLIIILLVIVIVRLV